MYKRKKEEYWFIIKITKIIDNQDSINIYQVKDIFL